MSFVEIMNLLAEVVLIVYLCFLLAVLVKLNRILKDR